MIYKDKQLFNLLEKESHRMEQVIQLIASENYVSKEVMLAQGSILTNKYAEGYPSKRYYHGCEIVDQIEQLAIDRCKTLFNAKYANVQSHAGTQANITAYLALITPGDTVLGMSLNAGGHLTHGHTVSLLGRWFNAIQYHVNKDGFIDYDEVRSLALQHKPKMIIAGFSAYSRPIDFAKFREIADEVGAYLFADIAHIAGLVVTGYHANPLSHAHIVNTTTHKTLRGPRGAIMMTNDLNMFKKIQKALFPGSQGGPLVHVIAAKAVAFKEALHPDFKKYIGNVINNARVFAQAMIEEGFDVITGGTDNHMFIVDLRKYNITGREAADKLSLVNIIVNANTIPFDPQPPYITSGIRIGTPAITTRGLETEDCKQLAKMIREVVSKESDLDKLKKEVLSLCNKYPIYNFN